MLLRFYENLELLQAKSSHFYSGKPLIVLVNVLLISKWLIHYIILSKTTGGKENRTKYIWGYTYWYMPYPVDKFKAYQKERKITLAQMRAKRHKITDF